MRPTKKITLPFSKTEVEIVTYFTRGEKNEIQKLLLSGAKMINGNPEMENIAVTIDVQDKTLEIAVKSLTISEINELPEEDGDFLAEEVNKLSKVKKK